MCSAGARCGIGRPSGDSGRAVGSVLCSGMADGTFAFGPFVLDTARGALLRDGAPVGLGQRALAVLAALAATPGRTVSKADLLARAWPGVIVEEGNLTVQIAALRKALGQTDDGRDWILTVPRVGYRLVGAGGKAAAADAPAIPRLAVLPFANLGGGTRAGVVQPTASSTTSSPRSAASAASPWSPASRPSPTRGGPRTCAWSRASSGCATCSRAACGAPAISCGSPPSWWTARPAGSSGPSTSTARRRTSSRSRIASPRPWRCMVEPASRRRRSSGRAANGRAASRPTTSTCRP